MNDNAIKYLEDYFTTVGKDTPVGSAWDAVKKWHDETKEKKTSGCPCTLVDPCGKNCSCSNSLLSGGCTRCCSYGSLEQRKAMAQRIVDMEEEFKEYALETFYEIATLEKTGEHEGWYCTNARSSAVGLGDRLVELGVFKKSDKGFGRVQYFRSINEG